MEILIVIVVVLVVVAGIGVLMSRRGAGGDRPALPVRTPEDEQRALHGDVRRLAPGDVVAYEGTDYVIDRTMRFDEDGFRWDEHFLTDAVSGRKLWLSVEDDEGVEVAVYERVQGAALEPDAAEVTHESTTYRRDERGRARYTTDTTAGTPGESGTVEYADYVAGDRLLAFERYGTGSWEVSTGQRISEHVLDVYPRSA
jgi:hypothetical protein